ncbi:MAG: 2-amino-5-chloromuconate deaminase CnbZ [Stellaceae bacterium]
MANVSRFQPGGYRFIEHAFQYSGGMAAEPGFAIERARFARLLPLAEGFDAVETYLTSRGRPPAAFCACELRSPAQFTDAGFVAFNRHYVQRLEAWGVFRDDINPVARSNVCPQIDPPAAPSLYAFCYTVPAESSYARTDFVAAGSGEADGASGPYAERIVRRGDTSPEGLREKARFVLGAMEARMGALGRSWADITAIQLYTVFDIYPALVDEFVRRGATAPGLTWHYARPPVQGLDVEVDLRGISREIVL